MYIQFPKQRIPHFVQVTKHNVLLYGTNTASSVAMSGDEIDKEKKCRKQQIKRSVYGSLLEKCIFLLNLMLCWTFRLFGGWLCSLTGQVLPSLCPLFCKNQPVICSAKHPLFNTRQLIRLWPCDGEDPFPAVLATAPAFLHCTSTLPLHNHSTQF